MSSLFIITSSKKFFCYKKYFSDTLFFSLSFSQKHLLNQIIFDHIIFQCCYILWADDLHTMFNFNSFDFEECHFFYWSNQLYCIINSKLTAEFKAASNAYFEISNNFDDSACKHILEDHLIWDFNQLFNSLLLTFSFCAVIKHLIKKRIQRENEWVRITIIDVSRVMQHAELF